MKRPLVRVNLVKTAVYQAHFDVDQVIAGQVAALHRIMNTLLSRLDKLARNRAALDLVLENKTLTGRRFNLELNVSILTTTTGLLLENLFARRRLRDGFAIGNLRLTDVRFHSELALHAIDDNLQMQFAHPSNDRLTSFLIGRNNTRRIFLRKTPECYSELVLICAGLGLDSDANYRRGKLDRFQNDRLVFVANCVAGGDLLHAADGDDFAGACTFNNFTLICVHAHQTADPFARVLGGVVSVRARFDRATINAHERKLAEVLVSHDFEYQSAERSAGIRWTRLFVPVLRVDAFDRRNIERRRQIINHRIEQRLHAFILESRTRHDWNYPQLKRTFSQRFPNFIFADWLSLDVLVHQVVVDCRNSFNQFLVGRSGFRLQLFRDSTVSYSAPFDSSFQIKPFIAMMSTTPLN